jgi:hypothetical protein
MWGGSPRSDLEDCYINLLSECVNLTTLALYFPSSHSQSVWTKLRDTVLTLTINGKLTSLAFYSYELWRDSLFNTSYYNIHIILQGLADSEIARSRLKSLHLAFIGLYLARNRTTSPVKLPKLGLPHHQKNIPGATRL